MTKFWLDFYRKIFTPTNLNFGTWPKFTTPTNINCRPQVQFLPLSLVVPQFFIKGNSSNTPILFDIRELWFHTLHYVAWRRELKHVKFHLRETFLIKLHPLWFSLPLLVGLIAIPRLRLVLSNIQPNRQAKPNQVQNNKKERENGRDRGRGIHNVPQYIAALQRLKWVA